ncbi:MAG: hypothetical protein H6581_25540 [Bacteroidia bacterium]|nr:hypothetical protein [Bacteroidia bacterium]
MSPNSIVLRKIPDQGLLIKATNQIRCSHLIRPYHNRYWGWGNKRIWLVLQRRSCNTSINMEYAKALILEKARFLLTLGYSDPVIEEMIEPDGDQKISFNYPLPDKGSVFRISYTEILSHSKHTIRMVYMKPPFSIVANHIEFSIFLEEHLHLDPQDIMDFSTDKQKSLNEFLDIQFDLLKQYGMEIISGKTWVSNCHYTW